MRPESQRPLTLFGPHVFYRWAYFGIRYLGAAFSGALLVFSVAFIASVFKSLGVVGGLVLTATLVLSVFFGILVYQGIMSAIRPSTHRRSKGYLDIKVRRGDVIVTSAHDLTRNED